MFHKDSWVSKKEQSRMLTSFTDLGVPAPVYLSDIRSNQSADALESCLGFSLLPIERSFIATGSFYILNAGKHSS